MTKNILTTIPKIKILIGGQIGLLFLLKITKNIFDRYNSAGKIINVGLRKINKASKTNRTIKSFREFNFLKCSMCK